MVCSSVVRTTFKIPNLIKGTEYQFRVRAENKYGVSEALPSEAVVAQHQYKPPGPPGRPVVYNVTSDGMTIQWEAPGYDGVTNLTEGNEYEFHVMAENNAGIGPPSSTSRLFKCKEPTSPPSAPTVVKVTDSSKTSVSLEWTKPVFDGGMEIIGYIIEMCKASLEEWHRVNTSTCINTYYTVTDLEAGEEYKFRVCAVNGAGKGETSEIPNAVQTVDRLTSPEIDIDASFKQTHIVKNGGTVTLHIPFKGKPPPLATWTKADGEIGVMADINTTETSSTLTIESCTRYDAGKYTLSLENNSGRKSITFTVKAIIATEEPAPPKRLDIIDTSNSTATLAWLKPEHDGGSRITGYIVETKAKGSDHWVFGGQTKSLHMVIEGLVENTEYDFRVKAKNDAGLSDPRDAFASVIIKEPRIEPTADLSGITNQLITCKTGSTFTIDVPISGRPAPKVTWKLEEMKLKETDRILIKTTKERTYLTVKDSMRGDSGKYYLILENIAGTKTFTVTLALQATRSIDLESLQLILMEPVNSVNHPQKLSLLKELVREMIIPSMSVDRE
uniref:Titin n=1 Tax=Paramormyrops kingsleyae TaxID=1676925 RepID=A0A3B3Q977_9TELE